MVCRTFHFYLVAIVFVVACFPLPAIAEETIRPITTAKSVLAIYTQGYGLAANGLAPHELIFAAWDDGYVVWSENWTKGGIPYRAGRIDPARLQALLDNAAKDGLLDNERLAQPKFGPDSSTTIILAKMKDRTLRMQSWHELYEARGNVVATDRGLVPLDERPRYNVLAKEPTNYLLYRLVWNELRLGAASLLPAESKPIDGKLLLRDGNAYWMESPPGSN